VTSSDETATAPPPVDGAANRIARGTRFRPALMWSYVLSTGTYTVTALMTFILAAILGPAEFGVLWMAIVWVTLAQILLQHGPTLAVIQHEDITDRHLDAAFWSTIGGAVLFAGALAAAAPLWAAVNRLPELTMVCLALVPIVPLYALNVIPEAVLRRRMQLRGIAVRYLTSGLVSGSAGVACALAGLGVWALVVQQVGMALLNTVLLWLVTPWRPRWRPVGRQLRDIRGTSLKTLAGGVGVFVTARVDVLLMGAMFGPVVVGLFRFAVRFPEMVVDVTARGLQTVSLPDLARHGADARALADRLTRLVHAGAVFSVPTLGVLAAAAEPLVLIIGEQWAESVPPLRMLCLVSVFLLAQAMLAAALQAAGRPGLPAAVTWVTAGGLSATILLAALATSGAGTGSRLMAIAIAMLAVHLPVALVLGYLTFRRVLQVPAWPTIRTTVPSVAAALAALATGAAVPSVVGQATPVAAFVVTGALAGATALVVLLLVDREVRTVLGRLRRPGSVA
jgi:O-antigen/teichoic acid export membrane protein